MAVVSSPLAQRRALLALALGTGLAPALLRAAPATPALQLPPAPTLSRQTLANGLELIALPMDNSSSSVAVQLFYRVGGKDDPPGRSGFAHLFEHLMFKGTRHMAAEQFDRLTEDVGGSNNAFTAEDMTVYHSVVPAQHLEPLLWAEAERMDNLSLDQASFDSERAVVKEEYRQRVLADPYGRLFNAIPSYGYLQHPYKRPVIGNIAELDAATLQDVREFHARHYRPDNALLVVAGRFDEAQLQGWVARYFGRIPAPAEPLLRPEPYEPRRLRNELHQLRVPGVPLPAALAIWQGPRAGSPDALPLQLAQALLAQGDAARLNEALVYRQRCAQSVGFEAMLNADAGLLAAYATAVVGVRADRLLAQLTHEVRRLAEAPVSAAELAKAKAQLLTQSLLERETPEGLGLAVGQSLLLRGTPEAAWRDAQRLQELSAEDVQRALRRYIVQGARVAVLYGEAGRR